MSDKTTEPSQSTALAVPPESSAMTVRTPSAGARRVEIARRVVGSRWTAVGVAGAVAVGLAAPLPVLAPLGFAAAYLASSYALSHRMRKFMWKLEPAFRLAETGDFSAAIAECVNAMNTKPWPVSHLATLTLAYFLRRQGRFDKAIELNGLAARDDDGFFRASIGTELAVCYALKGTTGAAMTWLPPIKRKHATTSASYAMVWARTGKADEVWKLRVKVNRGSRPFVQHDVRLLAVMKAYAVFKKRPDYLSIRPLLLEAGPAFASEFAYVGKSWPELKEFIDTYVEPADGRVGGNPSGPAFGAAIGPPR